MTAPARVLIVEDDADGREPLAEVLRAEGYDVAIAGDGGAAIAQLDGCDVLVVDLGLPDIDCLDIIRSARALPVPPAVVVFTGHHRLMADAEAAGCAAFVLKPDLDALLAWLGSLTTSVAARKTSGDG